jgi:hypothetical protein
LAKGVVRPPPNCQPKKNNNKKKKKKKKEKMGLGFWGGRTTPNGLGVVRPPQNAKIINFLKKKIEKWTTPQGPLTYFSVFFFFFFFGLLGWLDHPLGHGGG